MLRQYGSGIAIRLETSLFATDYTRRILIIGKDKNARQLFSMLFHRAGYLTIETDDAATAVEIGKNLTVHVVLLDIDMAAERELVRTKFLSSAESPVVFCIDGEYKRSTNTECEKDLVSAIYREQVLKSNSSTNLR